MIKYSEQTRLAIFLLITILTSWGYQTYFNNSIETEVNDALKMQNRSVRRYVQMLEQARTDKEELKQKIIHLQSMYDASKFSNNMLEQQIDVVSHYWMKECIRINDELFDIKNTDK